MPEVWYDLVDDYDLIYASFRTQYGIDLRTASLEYTDFLNLCGCLMADTPLGNVVNIRSEKDPEALKNFTPEQKRIRDEWLDRNKQKFDMDALFKMALA